MPWQTKAKVEVKEEAKEEEKEHPPKEAKEDQSEDAGVVGAITMQLSVPTKVSERERAHGP